MPTAAFGLDNAIAWAQFQLRGGLRNVLSTAGIYALCLTVALIAWMRLTPNDPTTVLGGATRFLIVGQFLLLAFYGSTTLSTALRNDVNSRMIDSHRLMPLPPVWAVLGYMSGATAQAVALAVVNFVIGSSTALGAGMPYARFLVPHLILVFFIVMVWSLVTLSGFFAKGTGWIGVVLTFSWIGNGLLLGLMPGMMLLMSPLHGSTLFSFRSEHAEITWGYLLAFIAQTLVSAIVLTGATRKYRRTDAQAMGVWLALAALATWVAMNVLAVRNWEDLRPRFAPRGITEQAQLIGSLCSAMVLAILPVANAAQRQREWERRRALDDPALTRRPLPPMAVAIIAMFVVLATATALPWNRQLIRPLAETAVVVTAFLVGVGHLLRLLYAIGFRPREAAGAYLILLALVPLGIDYLRDGLTTQHTQGPLRTISTFSPVGALLQIWGGRTVTLAPGLSFQVMIALLMTLLFYFWKARTNARPAAETA